jgi:hypothetical protein
MDQTVSRLLITGACVAVTLVSIFVLRRLFHHEVLKQNNEFLGYIYAVVGGVYGVYLAFTIIVVWEQFEQADQTATSEAVHLSEAWRDVTVVSPPLRDALHDRLIAYASNVVHREWPSMAQRTGADAETAKSYEDAWRALYDARAGVSTPTDLAFFNEAVRQMNELGMQRRLRILSAESSLPPLMWFLLVGGGIITVLFTFVIGTRHVWVQALASTALTALIVLSLLLVAALQHPFAGDVSVKPEAFESVLKSFADRQRALREHDLAPVVNAR